MKTSFIAIGTNIEPRETHFKQALSLLNHHKQITIIKRSSIYETAPVGFLEQSHFLNGVIQIDTSLSPHELLDVCQRIEHQLGRERIIKNGPRTIDLDILLYDDEEVNDRRLTIPHPRMQQRAFVLIPLEEIRPDLYISAFQKNIRQLCDQLQVEDKEDVIKYSG